MDLFYLLVLAVCALLGVCRAADLAFFTDAATGLCTAGSVWWRYAALGVAVLLCVAAGRLAPGRPRALCCRRPLAGCMAAAAGLGFTAAGFARLLFGMRWSFSSGVRAVLDIACAVWLYSLGRAWLRGGEWKTPTRSLVSAVLGGAAFYWRVLARFMENSSSWHRVAETSAVWQYLAALVFLAALARSLYLPDTADGKTLCASGLAAFCLCLYWEAPRAALSFGQMDAADLSFSLGLCLIGGLGGACALICRRGAENIG